MSKLDELIEKLCPSGVKYLYLGELEDNNVIQLGRGQIISKEDINSNPGDYPVYSSSSTGDGEIGRYGKYMFDDERITWSIDGGGKFFYRNNLKYSVTNVGGWIKVLDEETIITKFLYYTLINHWSTREYNYTKKAHPSVIRKEYCIPVPPLEVQCEIVHILDNFTLLLAELSAELKARQKQFKYYREKMITKSEGKIYKLDSVVDIYLGLTHTPKYVEKGIKFISAQNTSKDYLDLENVKYISESEYKSITENAKPKKNDILFTRVGSNLGHPVIVNTDEKLCIFVSLGFLRVKNIEQVSNKYIKHWINTEDFWKQIRKNVHGSAKVNLNTGWLKKFEIKIPDLQTQLKIVEQLDKLEKISNDINIGLPAEIEARQKQYEYYRNKLLTFKGLKVNE